MPGSEDWPSKEVAEYHARVQSLRDTSREDDRDADVIDLAGRRPAVPEPEAS